MVFPGENGGGEGWRSWRVVCGGGEGEDSSTIHYHLNSTCYSVESLKCKHGLCWFRGNFGNLFA